MRRLINWFNILIKKRKALKRWQRIVTVLAAVITFATTYALILPAITVEKDNTSEVAGMYLEKSTDADGMQEDNALEPTGVTIAADMDNAVTFACSDDDMTATAVFSTDEDIPEGAELVVNPVDPESEEYAGLRSRSEGLLDKEFIYDVTTCSFYDFALICDNVDVTPKTGLVDIHIIFRNNTVEHVNDMLFVGRFARPAEEVDGFMTVAADTASPVDGMSAVVNETIDTKNNSNAEDELVSANSDDSSVIELADGIITSLALKGNDLARNDSIVGILAGNVDEETKAAAAETAAEIPDNDGTQEESEARGSAETDDEEISTALPVKTLKASGSDYTVTLSYDESSGIPDEAVLDVSEIAQDSEEYQTYLKEAKKAMGLKEEETLPSFAARFFDIKIMVRNQEFTPETGVSVEITYNEPLAEHPDTEVSAVHFADESAEAEVIEANTAEVQDDGKATVEFTAESFSVYGVIYTVDFHWEVDGKTYDFSIPGGGFVSLEHLVEVLGIASTDENKENGAENEDDFVGEVTGVGEGGENGTAYEEAIKLNEIEVSEATKKFVADVDSVEFSNSELVWVGKVENASTVGDLKEEKGLKVEHSAELTEEQIAEINAQIVEAGDWALISVQPFTSEESLTITMKNGDKWTVCITDNQLMGLDDIDKDETYVLYAVQNGTTYVLKTDGTTEPLGDRNLDMLDNNYKWKIVWRYTDQGDNYKHYYSVIPETDPYKAMSLSWFKEDLVKDSNTNQIYIEESGDGTFYFGGYNHVVLAFEDESFQGRHGPWYWRWARTGWDRSTIPWTPIYEPVEISDWHYTNNDDTEHSAVPMVIYKQEDVDTYEFYVKTDSLKQGYITGTDKDGQSFSENNIVEHVTVTNNNKKNKYEITAVPQSDKYLFDYWDLDGVEQTYGATIPANTIPITANGNILTAHFKNNPNWNPETKPGRDVDEGKLLEWINDLKNQDHLMDPNGFSKTAEVYDYENRVYRIDLTAKSDFSTISGVADLGFVLDVSSSMRFPASLTEYRKNGNNVRIKANDLSDTNSDAYKALSTNQTYYLIADETSTATVFRLNCRNGTWYRQDASKTGDGNIIYSNTAFQGETGKTYQIYTADGAPIKHDDYTYTTTRLDYLKRSISNTDANNLGLIQELQDILNNYLSRGATDDDKANEPEVKIAYNTFNKTLQANDYTFKSVKKTTPTITTNPGGGTSTDVGLLAAAGYKRNESNYNTNNMTSYDRSSINGYPDLTDTETAEFKENNVFKKDSNVGFAWDPNSSKYVVLITDGAPQRNGNDIDQQMVKDAANYLKAGKDGKLGTDDDVTLITVGLSMGNVKKGANLLWELADRDENNDPYFYDAQDPSELKIVLYEILQTVTGKAIVVGDVTDTINDAFYPVDLSSGKPLENGNVIDLNGNWIANRENALTEDQKAAGYGVISKSEGLYTVKWTGQDFVPTGIGWHGTVYVKAKEDFFGGNTVRTNYNDAKFKATGYKGKPGDVTVNLASEYQEEKEQESPRVNVDELHLTNNSTEWTVYLGTEVNPKDELQKIFNKIEVEEEVFSSTTDKTKVNGNKVQYRYDFVEDTSDQRIEKTGEPVKFTLAELLEKLPESEQNKLNWDTLISLADQPVKPAVNQGEPEPEEPEGGWNTGITLDYIHYNQDYPGTITITLVKDHDPHNHVTDQVGDSVETYTLSVFFSPDYTHMSKDQGGLGDVEYHTGKYRTGSEGVGTGTQKSTNTHTINVFSKPLDILKVDKDNEAITEKPATFELLRPWAAGDTDESKKVIFGTTPGYTGYKLDGADLTGTYYLVDTQDTDTDTGIAHFGTGTDAAKLLSSAKDPYIIIEKAAPSGYAKDVNAKTITIITDGTNMNLYSDLNKAAVNNANYPSTGNPYNWNQAVKFQVTEYNVTSEENQTSVVDYVDKDSGAEITLKQPVYTAGNPWRATGSARNPIYVFSNIENTKELIRDDVSGVGVFRISFINEPGGIDIIIHKVDDKGVALPGATFKLVNGSQIVTVSSTGDGVVIEPKVTGETVTIKDNTFTIPSGGVTIKNLQTSDTEYAIVEVDSPAGYVITNDTPVKFKVTSGELTDKTMTTGVEYAPEGNDFTIPNTPGAALPSTGGSGTNMIYFLGIILTSLTGASFMMRKRCKMR